MSSLGTKKGLIPILLICKNHLFELLLEINNLSYAYKLLFYHVILFFLSFLGDILTCLLILTYL